jgi:hypothetical protein
MPEARYHKPTPRGRSPRKERKAVFDKTGGFCFTCPSKLVGRWIVEHVIPLEDGGPDTLENKQPSCVKCATAKTSAEATQRAYERKVRDNHTGIMPPSDNPIPGSRSTKFKRCMNGAVINRETGEVVRQGWR